MAIDDLLLARAPVADPAPPPPRAAIAPNVLVKPGLALLGIGGRF